MLSPDDPANLALALDLDRLIRWLDCSMRPRMSAADHVGVGPFGAMVLASIADLEPIPLQALSHHLDRDKAQITRTVQMLERESLVTKERSTDDGRVWLASLTPDGHRLAAAFQAALAEIVSELFGELDEPDRKHFARILAKIVSTRH